MQINARVEVNHEEILEQMLRENGVKEVASCMYNILWCMRDKLGTSKKI